MANLTKKEKSKKNEKKKKSRSEFTEELRSYHQETLDMIEGDFQFIPKFAFYRKGTTAKDGKVVQFFENELKKGVDIYMERIDREGIPEDPDRTLYRLRHNKYFREEYESEEKTSKSGVDYKAYVVPFEEFEIVRVIDEKPEVGKEEKIATKSNPELPFNNKDGEDIPWEKLSARDRACIQLKVPMSNKSWLNEIIKNSINGK